MFALSKIFGPLASPDNLLLLLLVAGTALMLLGRRSGRLLVAVAALALLAVAVLPVGSAMLRPLEERFARPAPPPRVDGIVVLGGFLDPSLAASRDEWSVNDSSERLLAMLALARRYPSARLIFTGGSGDIHDQDRREADELAALLDGIGFNTSRVVFERESRNTWENAVFSRRLADPKPGEVWLLVTSAWHMPRSVGCFRAANFPVVPWPVDYRTRRPGDPLARTFGLDLAGGLDRAVLAAHEWYGLLAYHLMGRTDALWPGPEK
ncbi:protein of unknown function DUF218 [Desulfovibrio sp. X2]|uniref:YdcF family protein n=1 Tax=Desulfovibrio sp. X2 TaxID=941449 RepID=UPI000358716A|nr:YdcF family protein [Desulfovibrio sp. X2]EPR43594.1 protein of unknown function DUF218 [Desulfovibrio sp. X2]